MWRRHNQRPSTAIAMLMAVVLVLLIVLGAALLVQLLWALLAVGVYFWLKRRAG